MGSSPAPARRSFDASPVALACAASARPASRSPPAARPASRKSWPSRRSIEPAWRNTRSAGAAASLRSSAGRSSSWAPGAGTAAASSPPMRTIDPLLHETVARGASDLHVTADSPPFLRIHGELLALEHPPLSRAEARALCYGVLTEERRRRFEHERELDFAVAVPGLGRFRGNLYFSRGTVGGAFRVIPADLPVLDSLGLPPMVAGLACMPRGLVLVSGATGSGKSTTLAAMVDHVNRERRGHIVSLEDPIEFLHEPTRRLVTQRELTSDTGGFARALRQVLRQDPDVVLVGEMRDPETIEAALTVAETGHLVLSTLHTGSAVQAIT